MGGEGVKERKCGKGRKFKGCSGEEGEVLKWQERGVAAFCILPAS